MFRFLLILGIMGAFGYFGYSIVIGNRSSNPTSAIGAANAFVQASVYNNPAWIERISERAAAAQAKAVGGRVRTLIAGNTTLTWQPRLATTGQTALGAVIPGQRMALVVEVNRHGADYKVAAVGLVAAQ